MTQSMAMARSNRGKPHCKAGATDAPGARRMGGARQFLGKNSSIQRAQPMRPQSTVFRPMPSTARPRPHGLRAFSIEVLAQELPRSTHPTVRPMGHGAASGHVPHGLRAFSIEVLAQELPRF
ncbi:hypothetical protein, partial [Achromobacter denitrificans]|uniref:hypothetical protein n=1 Tax=Achromobacter denitrificans TaxID=32002 RepID=UPI001C3F3F68